MQTPSTFDFVSSHSGRRLLRAYDSATGSWRAYEPGKLAEFKNSFGRPTLGNFTAGKLATSTCEETPAVFYSDPASEVPGARCPAAKTPSATWPAGGVSLDPFNGLDFVAFALAVAVTVVSVAVLA